MNILLNNVEDATAQFDLEMANVVPDADAALETSGAGMGMGNGYGGDDDWDSKSMISQHSQQFAGLSSRNDVRGSKSSLKGTFGSSSNVGGGAAASGGGGNMAGQNSPPKFADDPGYLSMENFFNVK